MFWNVFFEEAIINIYSKIISIYWYFVIYSVVLWLNGWRIQLSTHIAHGEKRSKLSRSRFYITITVGWKPICCAVKQLTNPPLIISSVPERVKNWASDTINYREKSSNLVRGIIIHRQIDVTHK